RAVLIGEANDLLTGTAAQIADEVTLADDTALAAYQPEVALAALTEICRRAQPQAVLLGNDTYSQELAPRLAHRLGGSAVGDAIEVIAPESAGQGAGGRFRVRRS